MKPTDDPIVEGCRKLSKIPGPKTLEQISKASGVTRSAVFQAEQKALRSFIRFWTRKYGYSFCLELPAARRSSSHPLNAK